MIIHLRENSFKKIFLTESTNSKRADKQTIDFIAFKMRLDPSDPQVIQQHQMFKQFFFGVEGVNDDWFIVLEPNFCYVAYECGLIPFKDCDVARDIRKKLQHLHRLCKYMWETSGRQAMLEYISMLRNEINGYRSLNDLFKSLEGDESDSEDETQYEQGNYKVIGPVTYEVAEHFGMYTAHGIGDEICYAHNTFSWYDYTEDGFNAVYIMLRDDWETLYDDHDNPTNPSVYDTYGLSMIWVIVDENGDLHTSNSRWNHDGNFKKDRSVDLAFGEGELSDLLGRPFEQVFRPLREVGYMPVEKVEAITGEHIDRQ